MSTLRLKNKKDIKRFFKILAEESVKEARSQMSRDMDADPDVKRLLNQEKLDNQAFGSIREEEDAEGDAGGEDLLDAADELEDSVDSAAPEEAAAASSESSADIEQVSLDSIRDKIKSMRSGLSVDDSAVQNPMRTYFDLLNDPERKALYAFLDALASIMTGSATGETAVDPSDPPYNVQMSSGSEEEEEAEDEAVESEAEAEAKEDVAGEDSEEEAPPEEKNVPIQVGSVQESASLERIRNKVKELLKKS